MLMQATSKEYVLLPFEGPTSVNLALLTPSMAIIPEDQGQPEPDDWTEAEWVDGSIGLIVDASLKTPGSYLVFGKVVSGNEAPVCLAGRLRIGDNR